MLGTIPIVTEEPAQDFAMPDGVVWRRTGSCNRCGECCKSGNPFASTPAEAQQPCAMLEGTQPGLHACMGRSTDVYLNGCNVWPSIPAQIDDYPGCSYTFALVPGG